MSLLRSIPLLRRFDRDIHPALDFVSAPDPRDFISISIPDRRGTVERDNLTDPTFISILSIDGGGIRGIIVAAILNFLEFELQKLDGPETRIADYFHTIAGTSTGGLIATMLTCPDENGRPLFTAREILDLYWKERPKIFPQPRMTLCGDVSSMDKTTSKNSNDLVEFSNKLLAKPVSKRNPNTGHLEPCSSETNAEALKRFARLLSEGRKCSPALIPV